MKEETEEWRKQADDKLQLLSDIQGFSKISFKVIAFIVGLGGAVAVIIKYFHNFKNLGSFNKPCFIAHLI
jgi:hypothetical protein